MNISEQTAPVQVTCFGEIPEYHPPVEKYYAPELHVTDVLDGRFRIVEVLSRSGTAVIYKAEDMRDQNRVVALKVPHFRFEMDPKVIAYLQSEEEIGLQLNHPSLLKFITVKDKKRPYIVTEYVRGCTLTHLINNRKPLPEKDALQIAILLCDPLQYMHEHGIAHCDLKPDNVMISTDRTIRLLDFGIAAQSQAKHKLMSGFAPPVGTPDYMAPEQVTKQICDGRTDTYSLGIMLYEMLTGVIPFQDSNEEVTLNNRVTGDPVALRKLNPEISPQVEEIVLHAMQRDPANRYPSINAMKAELERPEAVEVTGYCERLQVPVRKLSLQRNPIFIGLVIGVAFLLSQGFLFYWLSHHLK